MTQYDLLVIGGGSGNMLFTPEIAPLRSAIVESDRFGGTCLNRGCIPSKMFVVAADAAMAARHTARLGVHTTVERIDWPAIRDRVFGRIDPIHERAVEYRRSTGVDVYTDPARFVAPKTVEVAGETLSADRVIVAAGSRPVVPDIPGLSEVPFHTSDTIMRLDSLPASMIILGGGFIAAEMGHVFEAFGTRVSIVQRGPRLLMGEDDDVSTRFTELAAARFDLHRSSSVSRVDATPDGIHVTVDGPEGTTTLDAQVLLVATGRRPNTDLLDVAAGGLEVDEHGHLVCDDTYRTNVKGVWAMGDAANHFQLKHMANAEMRVVTHNVLHPDQPRALPSGLAPHAVFSHPQIASVGLTEADAIRRGIDHRIGVRNYGDTAYGWALEDTTSFVKVLAHPGSRRLLGAHIIGPDAAVLLQPLLQAMMLGNTVDQMARDVLYIHPALTEVVENALLAL